MSIYILCAAVLITAIPLVWWIKREGERSWARHQALVRAARQREQMQRLTKSVINLRITLLDNLTPALQKAGREMTKMAAALREAGEQR